MLRLIAISTLALSAFAVNADYAFGLAVVAHATQYTLITSIGRRCRAN